VLQTSSPPNMPANQIIEELKKFSNPHRASFSNSYFPRESWDPRQDVFLGCSVPQTRIIAKKFSHENFDVIQDLLQNNIHEARLCSLMILRFWLDKALKISDQKAINNIWNCYMANLNAVDHWDLVDESSGGVIGRILVSNAISRFGLVKFCQLDDFDDPDTGFVSLANLACSDNIWHKRISIIAGFAFIKKDNLGIPADICQFHIDHKHHYIQKACGWILREVGKKDRELLDRFLTKNIDRINSICLSYALEKHSPEQKKYFRDLRADLKSTK
jgi:3-methyladenine DNA glycosylase AlkD